MDGLETERLILRHFTEKDIAALFALLSDREVNAFLPMFPLEEIGEAEAYLSYIGDRIREGGFYYAICLKEDDRPIGCVHVSADDSRDLGYAVRKEYWHRGICTEACRSVVGTAKRSGPPYLTATHDVKNQRRGRVIRARAMTFRYSHEGLVQTKNFRVTVRMYQLDLDRKDHGVYEKYWSRYPVHFIEEQPFGRSGGRASCGTESQNPECV